MGGPATQQQVLLVLAELFFQGVELAGGLIDIVLGADDADAAGGLAKPRLGYPVWPVIERFRRLQHRLTTGFLHACLLYTSRPRSMAKGPTAARILPQFWP